MPKKVKHYESRDGYDQYAEFYDKKLKYLDSFEQFKLLPLMADIEKKEILDAGCGTGRLTVKLAAMGAQVTALDISPKILNILKEKNKQIKIIRADAEKIPLGDKQFDYVVAAFLIVHLQNPGIFFREAWRVLKPGGAIVVTNINQKKPPELKTRNGLISIRSFYHRPEKIVGQLEEVGFSIKDNIFIKEKEVWINQIILADYLSAVDQ